MEDLEVGYQGGEGYEQTTDMRLISQAQRQQSHGWEVLAELYMPMVYRWSRQRGLQPADGCDVVQQVFGKLWNNIERFAKARPGDSFRAWLKTITKNEISNGRQQRAATPQVPHSAEPEAHDEADSEGELSSDVLTALEAARSRVTPQTWEIFVRTVLYAEPPHEVAGDLQLDANAVRQARFRVVRIVRKELQIPNDAQATG